MNFNDVAEFLELVKNPKRYEDYLAAMVAEQGRLNAAIETVGKASELDSMRKKLEKETTKKLTELDAKQQEMDLVNSTAKQQVEQARAELQVERAKAQQMMAEATAKELAAKALADSFTGRDKKLKEEEKIISAMREELSASLIEYNEKIAKLKAVMV